MLALVSVAVARPVPVIVTLPLAVVVLVSPEYCTLTVQLLPGLTTAPELQVPPAVIEKVPFPVPDTVAIVGLAVNVNGAVAPAALLTVIVPVLVLVPPVLSAGVDPLKATVAPVTVNGTVLLVPFGVVTLRFLTPSEALAAIVRVAVADVPVAFTVKVPKVMFG